MQDVEFTIEEGKLYILQTRNAKRPPQAAVRVAADMVRDGRWTKDRALLEIDASKLDVLMHPTFDPGFELQPVARGVGASPGAAKGAIVFTAEEAVAAAKQHREVILVRPFTEADDVAGFHAARGILTSEGGKASHAALVARGMGKPCVTGAARLEIDVAGGTVRAGDVALNGGDVIAIDGSQGIVTADDVPLVDPADDPNFEPVLDRLWTVLEWADEVRRLGIRTNADTPADAKRARNAGSDDVGKLEATLDRIHQLSEVNPMLGTRGVRLGIIHPEIFRMQVRAIMRAARAVRERTGKAPEVEIMIPLVAYETELQYMRAMVDEWIAEEADGITTLVGTMIELPRACFVANKIAERADFFSFGTNDLTQSALGFSRDDVESRILSTYLEQKIIDRSPFETIDKPGVGWLVRLAAWVGREGHPGLKLGICGEHGGDPDSIAFFDMAGLDYVSCSPFRVPIARLAAAQSALDPHPIIG